MLQSVRAFFCLFVLIVAMHKSRPINGFYLLFIKCFGYCLFLSSYIITKSTLYDFFALHFVIQIQKRCNLDTLQHHLFVVMIAWDRVCSSLSFSFSLLACQACTLTVSTQSGLISFGKLGKNFCFLYLAVSLFQRHSLIVTLYNAASCLCCSSLVDTQIVFLLLNVIFKKVIKFCIMYYKLYLGISLINLSRF